MPDNPRKTAQDRKLVSQQPYEVDYFARKHGLTRARAAAVIKQHGPSRRKCDEAARALKSGAT